MTETIDFDFTSDSYNERYYDVLAKLRATCPVARSESMGGFWVLTRYDDVSSAARDWQTFTSAQGVGLAEVENQPPLGPIELDPPQHSELRKILNPFFTAPCVAGIESAARLQAAELVDRFIDAGQCDFHAVFARPLPGLVLLGHFLELPKEDLPQLQEWAEAAIFEQASDSEHAQTGFRNIAGYMAAVLEQRAASSERKNDLIDALVNNTLDGAPLSAELRIGSLIVLLLGGLDTTTSVLNEMCRHLAEEPALRRRLQKNPDLHSMAIEEFLRLYSPGTLGRVATKDVVIGGRHIAEGDRVLLHFASTNRDGDQFPNPDVLDPERNACRHLAFGAGPHRCIGSNVAKVSLRAGLEQLLTRFDELELDPARSPTYVTSQARGATSMPIRFTAAR
ncbi:MAG TPA: cytochrome P450 [Acidimicrobiales bacterium]|nr:cytochrome P450 [Acidimicrobiales bacterium]